MNISYREAFLGKKYLQRYKPDSGLHIYDAPGTSGDGWSDVAQDFPDVFVIDRDKRLKAKNFDRLAFGHIRFRDDYENVTVRPGHMITDLGKEDCYTYCDVDGKPVICFFYESEVEQVKKHQEEVLKQIQEKFKDFQ